MDAKLKKRLAAQRKEIVERYGEVEYTAIASGTCEDRLVDRFLANIDEPMKYIDPRHGQRGAGGQE